MLARLPLDLVRATALLTAFGAAAVGILAWGGMFSARLDALTHFAGFGVVAGLLAWLAGLATGREAARATTTLAGVAVLAWGGLIAPELGKRVLARKAAPAGEMLKLVQFNTWGDGAAPPIRLAWLKAQNPDVIVLEEITNLEDPVMSELAKTWPYKMTCENRPYPCEVVVLAKKPAIAEGKFSGVSRAQANTAWATFAGAGGRPYTVVGVHIGWPTPDGAQQAKTRTLASDLKGFDLPNTVLAGDFNSTPWSFSLRRQDKALGLTRRTIALPSWPAGQFSRLFLSAPFPILPIDHVFAGSDWKTVKVERGPNLGSDHYPVAVTLRRDP